MNPIKEFFKKVKQDKQFKEAGPGHKLSESAHASKGRPGPSQPSSAQPHRQHFSEGAQRAGAAALARIEQKPNDINWSLQATKAQARKELELENALKTKLNISTKEKFVQDACPALTVSGVYFNCPLIGPEILPKKEIKAKIRSFLYEQLEQERELTACLIIHTMNENKEKVRCGIETLSRYLTNILDNPTEEKYHKIRVNNKAFQERIMGLEGAFEFLAAAGFNRVMEGDEEYFVFGKENLEDLENLQMLKEALLSAEPIVPSLDRNLRVLKPSQATVKVNLPDSFFHISAEELKREQEAKTETVELMTQLRTKAMRERDNIKELHMYKFTLMRIRFPDGIILQGTFYVHERFSSLKEFITENLQQPEREFHLMLPGGTKITENSSSLLELKLVPAVLLNFLWASNHPGDEKSGFLKPKIMALLADL